VTAPEAGGARIRVHLFAVAAERAGTRALELEVAGGEGGVRVADVRRALAERAPALASLLPLCALAVGDAYAADDAPVPPGAEVAVIPPVSGGDAPYARVGSGPIPTGELVDRVRHAGAGAVVVFEGTVRGRTEGRLTERLEYESHIPLAEREMARILAEVEARHPGARLAAAHRVGSLAVGETAVVVAASAPHRDAAFAAARAAIDRIKAEVPIWKREIGPDGAAWAEGTPVTGAVPAPGRSSDPP
jgi:molybdopterin synthase catalytic subunit/molybdopterin converting factor small subunit